MLAGTVATMDASTVYAAVATAASFEAVAGKRRVSRYGLYRGSIALTAS